MIATVVTTEASKERKSTLRAALGPGLVMAGAAIGVSHLVQSTRAGAEYGLALLALVLVGCIVRYPFLEFGPRYAAATGEHLIAGYRRLGRWPIAIFAFITLSTMFIVLASVTLVTAGLTGALFGLDLPVSVIALAILSLCGAILVLGHYRGLDLIMKIIMAFLAVATLSAVGLAAGQEADWSRLAPAWNDTRLVSGAGLAFMLALLGWMPIPLDAAAWHSLWTLERARATGRRPSVEHAGFDFAVGYLGATLMALAFVLLGALTLYGSGRVLPDSAVQFTTTLLEMYSTGLGEWSRGLIAFAALATMISTTLTVADAYPRVLQALAEQSLATSHRRNVYLGGLALVLTGAWLTIWLLGHQFTLLIDLTTTVAFLAAPVIAWLNYRLLTSRHTPAAARPGTGMRLLSWIGLAFLTAFSLTWLIWRLFGMD
ncbi:MAG: Nramp family divalent metal transporter [Wenzhouxiangellaceae bacterium]